MRIYALMGERTKALSLYQSCEELLKKEFNVAPTHETRKLAELIQRDETVPQGSFYSVPKPCSEFIGRQKEISSLIELLSDENKRLITLLGPGGIGKSTLVTALAEALKGCIGMGLHLFRLVIRTM